MHSPQSPTPYDVTGVVVRARPEKAAHLAQQLGELKGVEVHAISDEGNLVVTVEELDGERLTLDTLKTINNMPGVLSTSMVYHHHDEDAH